MSQSPFVHSLNLPKVPSWSVGRLLAKESTGLVVSSRGIEVSDNKRPKMNFVVEWHCGKPELVALMDLIYARSYCKHAACTR